MTNARKDQSFKSFLRKQIASLASIPAWIFLYIFAQLLSWAHASEEPIPIGLFLLIPLVIVTFDLTVSFLGIPKKLGIKTKHYVAGLTMMHGTSAIVVALLGIPEHFDGIFLVFVLSVGLLYLNRRAGLKATLIFNASVIVAIVVLKKLFNSTWGTDDSILVIYCVFTSCIYGVFFESVLMLLKRLKRASEKLKNQTEQLQQLDQQKTAFFQNMSHELRTPLTLILNPLEEASRKYADDKNIDIAAKNSRRLLRLVNQLLDFQKLEAGKQRINFSPVNLPRFMHICGDYFASACSSKDVEFLALPNSDDTAPSEEPLHILGEIDALEKITFNFLSNALKYTPKGGQIELGLKASEDKARIYIRDTGPGISQEGQKKLFQVFSQVDETTTRDYEGTGLGLALVKSLTEEMRGEVGVESEPGKGSTFWAEFPLCEAPDDEEELHFEAKDWLLADGGGQTGTEEDEEDHSPEPAHEGSGELVLVVDDLADMRTLIGNSLKKRNFRIATAPNGERGVELAQEINPDLIITDWMMPKMSGPELIAAIRDNEALKGTPIILLTAKSDEESKLLGKDIGADAFLGKPFNDAELSSTVQNLVRLKSGEKEIIQLNRFLTENVLKRYLPPALIEQILDGEISMDKPAEIRRVTILFSDLCAFTSTAQKLGPAGISDILNEYLTTMNDIIFNHGGTIDKFIGDSIMVIFGAPAEMDAKEQARRASACANEMQQAMHQITEGWKDRNAGHLKMRIGIHQGDAVVGNFGSDKRSDYTCIGPTVNIASRIEAISEPGTVFISEELSLLLPQAGVEPAGEFELKGVDGKLKLYRLASS